LTAKIDFLNSAAAKSSKHVVDCRCFFCEHHGCSPFILMIVGEDNYALDGRVVFLPFMGVALYCYDESPSGKSAKSIQDKKEVSVRY
jgi:hypothetical protein